MPAFLFVTCQVGANAALKHELARTWPELRPAYSRPGFLTFKFPEDHPLAKDLELRSVFARGCGYTLGSVEGDDVEQLAAEVWQLAAEREWHALHVWQRDAARPGDHDFEPGVTPLAREVQAAIVRQAPAARQGALAAMGRAVGRGQTVLDCVIVEPERWWVGHHQVGSPASRWPGGIPPIELPAEAVSRAYLKMEEALRWSRLPIRAGDVFAEIGCAPGGASQALLRRGQLVWGIDPAEVHPAVLAEPNFRQILKRGADLKRREYAPVRWLAADMNVAPDYTLDTVEAIVTHPSVHVRGLLLTLKLSDWKLAERVPEYLSRVRSWGFRDVRGRQLAYNHQEICVAALKHRSLRRLDVRRQRRAASPR